MNNLPDRRPPVDTFSIAQYFYNPVTGERGTDLGEVDLSLGTIDPHVASTEVRWGKKAVWVSTVHLRIDHNFTREGSPVLWETMIFGPAFESIAHGVDEFQARYYSQDEALQGHRAVVEELTKVLCAQGFTVIRHENDCPLLALQADYRRALEAAP